jgi:hypothetical protein
VDFFFFDFRLPRSTFWRIVSKGTAAAFFFPFFLSFFCCCWYYSELIHQPISLSFASTFWIKTKRRQAHLKGEKAERQERTGKGHTTRDIASNKKR